MGSCYGTIVTPLHHLRGTIKAAFSFTIFRLEGLKPNAVYTSVFWTSLHQAQNSVQEDNITSTDVNGRLKFGQSFSYKRNLKLYFIKDVLHQLCIKLCVWSWQIVFKSTFLFQKDTKNHLNIILIYADILPVRIDSANFSHHYRQRKNEKMLERWCLRESCHFIVALSLCLEQAS